MKKIKFHVFIAILAIFIDFISISASFGQRGWKIGIGNNLTEYKFVSSQGLKANYFKMGAGSSAFISSEKSFLDTTKFLGGTDRQSIYFQNNKTFAKLLSKITYEIGLSYNQYNATGDVQSYGFRYQTNYLGFLGGLGTYFEMGQGFSMGVKAKLYAQQLLQGTQELNGHFLDVREDVDFNKPLLFAGYSIELNKQVRSGIMIFVQGDHNKTFKSEVINAKTLNFSTYNLAFGIKFRPI